MDYKKIPLGKFIFFKTEHAATIYKLLNRAIGDFGDWKPSEEFIRILHSETDPEPGLQRSIPAGDLLLWSEDYMLPVSRKLYDLRFTVEWEITGWVLQISDEYASERDRIDKKIEAIRRQTIPPVKGFMSREAAKQRAKERKLQ